MMTRYKEGDRVWCDTYLKDEPVLGTIMIVRMGGYSVKLDKPIRKAYTDSQGVSRSASMLFLTDGFLKPAEE